MSDRGRSRSPRGRRNRSPSRERRRGPKSLIVRNVAYDVTSNEIRDLFDRYGRVRDVYIPLDYHSKRPRGFAFVEFLDPEDAREGFERAHGKNLAGRRIAVEFAKDNRKTSDEMRREQPPPRQRDRRSRSRDRDGGRSKERSRSRDRGADRYRDRSRSRDREDKDKDAPPAAEEGERPRDRRHSEEEPDRRRRSSSRSRS